MQSFESTRVVLKENNLIIYSDIKWAIEFAENLNTSNPWTTNDGGGSGIIPKGN